MYVINSFRDHSNVKCLNEVSEKATANTSQQM